jgi:hypothetical protein
VLEAKKIASTATDLDALDCENWIAEIIIDPRIIAISSIYFEMFGRNDISAVFLARLY